MTRPGAKQYELRSLLTQRLLVLSNTLGKGAVRLYAGRFGIPLAEWRLLAALAGQGPSSVNELAAAMATDKGWVSRTVAALTRKKLVSLRRRADYARRVEIAFTSAGRALYARIVPAAIERQRRLLSALTPAEQAMLDEVLAKLQRQAEILADAPDGDYSQRARRRRTHFNEEERQ